ncbi:MAG: trigger factor [Clostridiales bacterium]|nr:trigger factor [Clostridiales bacterium]
MAQFEKTGTNTGKLTIELSAETFGKALADTYRKEVKRYNIPGFRKGHAPRPVIERMYGREVFFEGAFEALWGDAYDAAVTEQGLFVVDRPELDILTMSAEEGVTFTADVTLKPELTPGQYKGIEVAKQDYTVTDAEIDAALQAELEKQARHEEVERPVQDGDRITLDYAGAVDGEYFEGGTASEQTLVIGSHNFIPGFEEQLVGAQTGEERDVLVSFPTEYHAEHLAGKEAVFHCKVHAVAEKTLPELDDEFIADISEFDTIAEWKANKRAELEKAAKERSDAARENEALEAACANATVEIPDCMIERRMDSMLRDMERRLRSAGMNMELYCEYIGKTKEELRESYREEAGVYVKMQLFVEAISKAESVTASPEEIDAEITAFAEENGSTFEALSERFTEDDRAYFEDRVITRKTIALVVEAAVEK